MIVIHKDTIDSVIELMRADNKTNQEIEDCFKAALRKKVIKLDTYCEAMKKIYGED